MKDQIRVKPAHEIWDIALGELQLQVSKANYQTWLQHTTGISYDDSRFVIGVPNTFVAEYLEQNQRSLIERSLARLTGSEVTVEFLVEPARNIVPARRKVFPACGQIALPGFNPKYTFDTFVVGDNNRLAHAAAREVVEHPGRSFNPLYVYGGAGLGKTHLLHAIGQAARQRDSLALYATAEQFTNEFVRALRQKNTEDFRRKYRGVDILLIDDIQFIGGKEQTEESFFHTFNELHNADRQIVLSSDCPPRGMPMLQNRLRSRFEWGLIVDLQAPDFKTREAILHAKEAGIGIDMPPEVLQLICHRRTDSVRDLEGCLNRVAAYCRLVQSLPTVDIAVRALKDIADADAPATKPAPTVRDILDTVAACFSLTPEDLLSRKRDKATVLARQVAMYLLREVTGHPLEQIGEEMGGRDHSTVIHACHKIATTIAASPQLKTKVEDLQRGLAGK